MPTVQRLSPDDAAANAAWDDFVQGAPAATFFHRAGWQRVLRDAFRHDTHYLFAAEGGRVVGVLPLAHVRSLLFGNTLTSLPFAVYGGVAARDEVVAAALEREAERLARTLGVAHLELRNLERRHPDWPEQDLSRASSARWSARGSRTAWSRPRMRASTASSPSTPTTCTATAPRRCRNGTSKPCAASSAPTARC
jgi:hypothetical protein